MKFMKDTSKTTLLILMLWGAGLVAAVIFTFAYYDTQQDREYWRDRRNKERQEREEALERIENKIDLILEKE